MVFVKVVKNKAYFKRFQTQFRRRREGKTDYYARRKLIFQAKNKYNTPKYRLCVRITNSTVIAQVIYADLAGDRVLCSAYSSELPRYGLKVGLTNFPAAYSTGLLLARRLLTKLNLDKLYPAIDKPTGDIIRTEQDKETYYVKKIDAKCYPFTAALDIGIRRSTLGARIFAVLKGAVDGGLNIPHNEKKLPGYNKEAKKFDPKVLRSRIFGENIKKYMKQLQTDEPEKYQKLFSLYIKNGVEPDNLEKLYQTVHSNIKADPKPSPKEKKNYHNDKFKNPAKKTLAHFKQRVASIKSEMGKKH